MVSAAYLKIYAVVRRIPRGRVATYGQVARIAGLPGQARQVGYALSALEEGSRVPWHRVVNARGAISLRSEGSPMATVQRLRLEGERVRFDSQGRIRLETFRWRPSSPSPGAGVREGSPLAALRAGRGRRPRLAKRAAGRKG